MYLYRLENLKNFSELRKSDGIRIMTQPEERKYWIKYEVEGFVATHSSTLAWQIPWMEEPSRLQSMGLLRVGHD